MTKLSKEIARQMKDAVMEMGYGWGVLYRDDDVAREQKATDVVNEIISLFCNEITKGDKVQDD